MYNLDFGTLLQLLQDFHHSGHLRAQLPPGTFQLQRGQIAIDIFQGNVLSCSIYDPTGKIVFAGEMAFRSISHLGPLDWIVERDTQEHFLHWSVPEPHTQRSLQSTDPAFDLSTFDTSAMPAIPVNPDLPAQQSTAKEKSVIALLLPQRLFFPQSEMLKILTRKQRRVFVLVDGIRTVEKISSILYPQNNNMKDVFETLLELKKIGIISLS